MFDVIFGMFSAWNVLGLILMGVVFMGIGGAILGWELYWRIFAYRLDGVITGIHVPYKKSGQDKKGYTGETYYSVLSFTGPNGKKIEQVSSSSSGYIVSRLPGKKVTVLYFPNAPEKTRRPNFMIMLFGALFFFPGVFIMVQAIKSFEFNSGMFLMIAVILGYIGYKLSGPIRKARKIIKEMPQEEWDQNWKDFKEKGITFESSSSSSSKKTELLTRDEIQDRLRLRYKNAHYVIMVCGAIALGLLGGAIYTGQNMQAFLAAAHETMGKVVRIDSEYNSSSEGSSYTYYSIVRFETPTGQRIEFRDSVGSSHRMHDVGEELNVLYLPDEPEEAMIDRDIWNWGLSAALFAASLIFFWAALFNVKALRYIRRL